MEIPINISLKIKRLIEDPLANLDVVREYKHDALDTGAILGQTFQNVPSFSGMPSQWKQGSELFSFSSSNGF